MTQHGRNLKAFIPVTPGIRELAAAVLLALAALELPMMEAAEKPSRSVRTTVSRLGAADDLDIEIHVLSALREAKPLDRLSVHVSNGVAYLLGPVPSANLKKQAVKIAGNVPGVVEVRSDEIYLAKPPPKPKPLTLPLESDQPTRTQSASLNALARTAEMPPPSSTRLNSPPSSAVSRPPWSADTPGTPSSGPRVTLMAPEAMAAPPRAAEPAVLTANPRTPPVAPPLSAAVERLRQSDRRFRSIHTEISGSTVRVFSGDAAGANVMAFVQAIRRVPGVRHVILTDTSTRPR